MREWLIDFWRYWNIEYHAQCPLNYHDFGIVTMTSHGRRSASNHRLLDHTTVPLWSEAIVVFLLQWASAAKSVSLSWLPRDYVTIMIVEIWHGTVRIWARYISIQHFWAFIHQADGRLTARSRKVSKARNSGLDFSNRSENWRAPRQLHCWVACHIKKNHRISIASRGFETSRDICPLSE